MEENDLKNLVKNSFIGSAGHKWRGMSVDELVLEGLDSGAYQSLEYKPDDIILVTFPKSGTTWTKSILYCLANHISGSSESPLDRLDRHIHDEIPSVDHWNHWGGDGIERFHETRELSEQSGKAAMFQFHSIPSLLPQQVYDQGCKVVYVLRNPKAAVLSYADSTGDLCVQESKANLDKDSVVNLFRQRVVNQFCSDDIQYGPWPVNAREAYERRNDENFLFLCYEEIRANPLPAVRQLMAFTGLGQYDDNDLERIIGFTGMDAMKASKAFSASFEVDAQAQLHKGESARWKTGLTEQQQQRIDDHVLASWPEGKQFLD